MELSIFQSPDNSQILAAGTVRDVKQTVS